MPDFSMPWDNAPRLITANHRKRAANGGAPEPKRVARDGKGRFASSAGDALLGESSGTSPARLAATASFLARGVPVGIDYGGARDNFANGWRLFETEKLYTT